MTSSRLVGIALVLLAAGSTAASEWLPAMKRALRAPPPIQIDDLFEVSGHCPSLPPVGSSCRYVARAKKGQHGLLEYSLETDSKWRDVEFMVHDGVVLGARRGRRWLHLNYEGWSEFAKRAFDGEEVWFPSRRSEARPDEAIAYLRLLGIAGRNEYGFVCEYSTAGLPPLQREAVMLLAERGRLDLLSKVLHGPNPEGQVYAADTLLYLRSKGAELSARDDAMIESLRTDPVTVVACGNAGAYRQYQKSSSELLSNEAAVGLLLEWKRLRQLGYR